MLVVPGARSGEAIKASDRMRVAENLTEGVDRKWLDAAFGPGKVMDAGVVGKIGMAQRKNGGKPFAAAATLVVVSSPLPAEDADAMARRVAKQVYHNAVKHYEVIPVSELKSQKP